MSVEESMTERNTIERNMFVAVQALRFEWIDPRDFVDACQTWAEDKRLPLSGVLEKRGHIDAGQRAQLEKLLESTLRAGQLKQALAQIADGSARETMRRVNDAEIQQTLGRLPLEYGVRMAPLAAEGDSLRRYRLTREYSRGGLSRIWLARDANLHRDVILKELHPQLGESEGTRRRFLNEAQITGQLEHPNIVPVYELGSASEAGMPFYTMRFLRGDTLSRTIARHYEGDRSAEETLEDRRLLGIFVSICNAIAYAHSRGVLHRDLKPQNVVLGRFGEVILLDWGLAKLAGSADDRVRGVSGAEDQDPLLTAEGDVLGTPAYLAPELAKGSVQDVDQRTDVYGLGGILFEMLTGRPPHAGETAGEVIHSVIANDSPRARTENANIPPVLDAICSRAMAKDPKERYTSALALVDDIQRYLADEPVSAYREPPVARSRRWMRRHRLTTVMVSFLLLSLGIAVLNLWWQNSRAIEQELEMLGRESREESGYLRALIDVLRRDAKFLAGQKQIQPILARGDGGAKDDLAGLSGVFRVFLQDRPNYFQARLLDKEGRELVRVERDPRALSGAAGAEPHAGELQDKFKSPYFSEAMKLRTGQVYLSPLELNREDGLVQDPEVPVLRAAVPVSARGAGDGLEPDGVVVINIDCEPLFRMLQGKPTSPNAAARESRLAEAVCVTNEDGYFLWNPERKEMTFGFEPERPEDPAYLIQSVYPDLAHFFRGDVKQESTCVVCGDGDDTEAVFVYRLGLDAGAGRRYLGLAVMAPYEAVLARAERETRVPAYTTYALIVALVAMLIWSFLVTRRNDRLRAARRAASAERFLTGTDG